MAIAEAPLRDLSDPTVVPEPAGGQTDQWLNDLLDYDKSGGGEQGFDLGATDAPTADQDETYVVQQGDTLNKISQDLGIPLEDLAKQNQITDVNVINVGQEIKYSKPGNQYDEEGALMVPGGDATPEGETLTIEGETGTAVADAATPAPGDAVTSTTAGDEAKIDFADEPVVDVEEPKIDAQVVTEEEILEEPGPDLEEQSKESAIQVAKSVSTGLSPDTKEVYDDVINKIDEMDITPTEGVEEYYNKLANNINDRIEDYNIAISNVADQKQKPTFTGWNKFLAVLGAAMGAYGSAMTKTPNYAQKIIDDAIDRDTQAFLRSKEIRTKALTEQRMDLIMRRGELLQLAQNRVNALMQSKTFELAKEEAKANIQGIADGLQQKKDQNMMNFKLAVAQMATDFYTADASLRSSLNKEQRKRMVRSFTGVDSKGNAVAIPAYLARDSKSAEKLTDDQVATMDALADITLLDELYESPEKYIPAAAGGQVSQEIDRITNRLELTFKRLEGMGANYTQYEQALIRGILPTSSLIDKISKYKVKSAMLRDELIKKLKTSARARGAAMETQMPTTKNNIENFGGTKGVSG